MKLSSEFKENKLTAPLRTMKSWLIIIGHPYGADLIKKTSSFVILYQG